MYIVRTKIFPNFLKTDSLPPNKRASSIDYTVLGWNILCFINISPAGNHSNAPKWMNFCGKKKRFLCDWGGILKNINSVIFLVYCRIYGFVIDGKTAFIIKK